MATFEIYHILRHFDRQTLHTLAMRAKEDYRKYKMTEGKIVSSTTIRYVRYFSTQPTKHRPEPTRGRSMKEIAKNASPDVYALSFYSIFEIVVEIDGRQETVWSTKFNCSELYHINARVFTVNEFAKHYPNKPETVTWADTNGHSHLIVARSGDVYHYQPEKRAIISID